MGHPLDDLSALLPHTATNVSAPMPGPMQAPSPQLAMLPNLPTQATPMRTADPSGHNPMHIPWEELLKTLAPVMGTLASGDSKSGFLGGFTQGQQMAQQEREKRTQQHAQKQQQAEKFRLEIFDQARTITDPQEWAQFVNLATESALHMGLISDPSEMKQFLTYPQHLADAQSQKELLDKLREVMKRPDFNDLMEHGATLTLKGGKRITLQDAVTITGAAPEVNGKPIAPPKSTDGTLKDVVVSVDGKKRFANHNPKTGKYTDPATGAELPNAVPYEKPDDPLDKKLKALQILREQQQIDAGNKKAEPPQASAFSQEHAARTLQSVRELSAKVSRWTTGVGSMFSGVPESQARNFKAELDTLKANIAFNELTQMREASKTGGALGAVSDREGTLLASVLGALDAGQSPANIKAQLKKIEDSVTRWQAANAMAGLAVKPTPAHAPTTPGTTKTKVGRFEVSY